MVGWFSWRNFLGVHQPVPAGACLQGRVSIITGANTGLGLETAKGFVERGCLVILACRNETLGREAATSLDTHCQFGGKAEFMCLDLASLESVHAFVRAFKERGLPLHILVNNAGVNRFFAPTDRVYTSDGLEYVTGVNHIGHFALTMKLVDVLKESAPSRVVNVSSMLHAQAEEHIEFDKCFVEPGGDKSYSNSKLMNVLFSNEFNRRFSKSRVSANSVHPGAVNTDIWRHIPSYLTLVTRPVFWLLFKSPAQGAATSIYAGASSALDGVGGKYYGDCKEEPMSEAALNEESAKRLWEVSMRVTKS